jgi:hypothetical protein
MMAELFDDDYYDDEEEDIENLKKPDFSNEPDIDGDDYDEEYEDDGDDVNRPVFDEDDDEKYDFDRIGYKGTKFNISF